jgi:hypothetical protein
LAHLTALSGAQTIQRQLKGKQHLEDLGADGKIILKLIANNSILSGGTSGGPCEHDKKSSISIKIAHLSLHWLLHAPCIKCMKNA